MSENSKTVEELRSDYYIYSVAAGIAKEWIEPLLNEAIASTQAKLAQEIDFRVKSAGSLVDKLISKRKNVSSLSEIYDILGVRVVVLYESGIDEVISAISSRINVVEIEDVADRLSTNSFGYNSIHIIGELPEEERLSIPNHESIPRFRFEIQVRTLPQHIWAVYSHELQYKSTTDVPQPLERKMARLAAILASVDDEFQDIVTERNRYLADLNIDNVEAISVSSIEKLLDSIYPLDRKQNEDYHLIMGLIDRIGIERLHEVSRIARSEYEYSIGKSDEAAVNPDVRAEIGVIQDYAQRNDKSKVGDRLNHTEMLRIALVKSFPYENMSLMGEANMNAGKDHRILIDSVALRAGHENMSYEQFLDLAHEQGLTQFQIGIAEDIYRSVLENNKNQ